MSLVVIINTIITDLKVLRLKHWMILLSGLIYVTVVISIVVFLVHRYVKLDLLDLLWFGGVIIYFVYIRLNR